MKLLVRSLAALLCSLVVWEVKSRYYTSQAMPDLGGLRTRELRKIIAENHPNAGVSKHAVDRADLEAIALEVLIERRQSESGIEGLWHTCIDSMRQLQRYYRIQRRKHPHELTLLVYVVIVILGPVLALHYCRKQGQPNTPALRVFSNPLAAPNVLDPFRMPGPGWNMAMPVDTASNDRSSDRMLQKQFEQVTESFTVATRETGLNQATALECAICLGYLRCAW